MKAIFYEQRDWGLVEVDRKDIPNSYSVYQVPQRMSSTLAKVLKQGIPPSPASHTDKTYVRIGQLPTGEDMYILDTQPKQRPQAYSTFYDPNIGI